jgi:catechol 2,3-dioxygenase-like lactoylglutathione lyase family enzyme
MKKISYLLVLLLLFVGVVSLSLAVGETSAEETEDESIVSPPEKQGQESAPEVQKSTKTETETKKAEKPKAAKKENEKDKKKQKTPSSKEDKKKTKPKEEGETTPATDEETKTGPKIPRLEPPAPLDGESQLAFPAAFIKREGIVHQTMITVSDMEKSVNFYTQVMGGELIGKAEGLDGNYLYCGLFQMEEIKAWEANTTATDIPNLRKPEYLADVAAIYFGHFNLVLIKFYNKETKQVFELRNPSNSVAVLNSERMGFYVDDSITLDKFISRLEVSAERLGFPVRCNRVMTLRSEEHRKIAGINVPQFNAYSIVEGQLNGLGWAHCEGPNGEQLQFAKLSRAVAENMDSVAEKLKERLKIADGMRKQYQEREEEALNLRREHSRKAFLEQKKGKMQQDQTEVLKRARKNLQS